MAQKSNVHLKAGWTAPGIVKKYEEDIRAAKTIADLESVKKRIKAEIDGIRK